MVKNNKLKQIEEKIIKYYEEKRLIEILKIKLRNLSYKEFNFKYYGEEGPIIEEQIN